MMSDILSPQNDWFQIDVLTVVIGAVSCELCKLVAYINRLYA